MESLGGFYGQALLLAIGVTRVATAFVVLRILSADTVPPLVRNSLFLGFGLIVLALQPDVFALHLTTPGWIALFLREALIGLIVGFFFGTILWAFESAGQIIDAKSGATMAQIVDPLTGAQTSLNGALLGRLANFVFMFSGGLLLLVTALLDSYAVWPIAAAAPSLKPGGVALFEGEFSRLMTLAIMFSAPAVVVLTVVEAGMGLVNRFAPQLNVFSMSLSIKAWLSTLVILATAGLLVQTLVNEVFARPEAIRHVLQVLGRPDHPG